MLSQAEIKAMELRAYGKRITFHTRFHWILTWLEELPGANLADKVWTIVDAAYRADYQKRGQAEMARYWKLLESFDPNSPEQQNITELLTSLSCACEYFNRSGNDSAANVARDLLGAVLHQQLKRQQAA